MGSVEPFRQRRDQAGIINREYPACGRLDINGKIGGRIDRSETGFVVFGVSDIGRKCCILWVSEPRLVQKQLLEFPSGQEGKSLRSRRVMKCVKAITVDT